MIDKESLDLLFAESSRAAVVLSGDVTMRAGGAGVTPELRDQLLAKVRAGEHVELELDVLAYEQRKGERNRNCVRIRDGALTAMAKTGVGTPVLKDHAQDDTDATAGRVIASRAEHPSDDEYAICQTWKLAAPWAVDMALRGLLSTVSIGWNATGPVLCSACNAAVFSKCYHYPGQRLAQVVGEDGVKRLVTDRTGSIVVEWIYTAAELVETSVVPVPAVTSARIEGIRAALSAHDIGPAPTRKASMNPELFALLGLAATAGDSEVLSAVKVIVADRAELAIAKRDLAAAQAELAILSADKRRNEADTFIGQALSSGKITKGDEPMWRDLFELNADRARDRMAARPDGMSTPVGQPRQSAPVIGEPAQSGALAATDQHLAQLGVTRADAEHFARLFGVKGNVTSAVAKHAAGQEVA